MLWPFRRRTRCAASPARPGVRLRLEPLEDRTVPAVTFTQTNLISDLPNVAQLTDPNLRNPWGVAVNPAGDFWVSNAASGTVTLYNGDVNGSAIRRDVPVISVPGAAGKTQGAPSGQVFNSTKDFLVNGMPALFIFAGLDGTLSAVAPDFYTGAPSSQAQLEVTTPGAVYTGLALANNGAGNFLYAANVAAGKVDVFDKSFHRMTLAGNFTDPNLPANLSPFNVANINGTLFVTYENTTNRFQGGIVDKFDTNGKFLGRFADGNNLNAPWGVVMAPASFGSFGGDLLVGNFGDGHINAYDPKTGALLGQLMGQNGQPLAVERLWQLTFGNGTAAGSASTLYFSSGLNAEKDGLFGSLREAAATTPTPSTPTPSTPTPTTPTPTTPTPSTQLSANNQFITKVYKDLLQRSPDPTGLALWNGQLGQGVARQQVVAQIENSTEYRNVEVRNLYAQLLHRSADPAGLSFFTGALIGGSTVEQVAGTIASSQEYFMSRSGGTNNGFLTAIYQDALNRTLDGKGQAVFTSALQAGATPGQVAAVIFASDEFKQDVVQNFHQSFLHRAANANGETFFVNVLKQGVTDEQVTALILASAEYLARP